MVLPNKGKASGPDAQGYYARSGRQGAPCRDVSWHPHYPVLASTSFDQTVKIWTLQNMKEEAKSESQSVTVEPLQGDTDEFGEENEGEDEMVSMGSGGSRTISM